MREVVRSAFRDLQAFYGRRQKPLQLWRSKCITRSRFSDTSPSPIGQILKRRQNDFHLKQKRAWKGNKPYRRAFLPDMFVIFATLVNLIVPDPRSGMPGGFS